MTSSILVTSVSSKVQLIQQLCLAAEAYEVEIHAADINPDSAGLYFAHKQVILPSINEPHFISTIIDYCTQNQIQYILPTRDEDLRFFAKHQQVFTQTQISLLMSDPLSIELCLNKHVFHYFCCKHALPTPSLITDILQNFKPCVAKLANSSASKGVFIINTPGDLTDVLSIHPQSSLHFEELISANEYSIDAFYDLNGTLVSAVARQRIKVVNGESSVSQVVQIPELLSLAEQLSKNLNLFGHITIQAFWDKKKVYLIEVNPRFGGASNLSIQAGLASPKRLIASIKGDYPELYKENKIKVGLKILRYSKDLFIDD